MALYQPLRGFCCDLHINEHLSVCSRYHFSRGQRSFRVFKDLISAINVCKHSILCSEAFFAHVTVYACKYVCFFVWVFSHKKLCSLALCPNRWTVAGEVKGRSQRWLTTRSPVQASFLHVCVCAQNVEKWCVTRTLTCVTSPLTAWATALDDCWNYFYSDL